MFHIHLIFNVYNSNILQIHILHKMLIKELFSNVGKYEIKVHTGWKI